MFTDYIKGYVVIKIDGIGKERFITLCGKRSIVLKNIYMQNNVYYARLSWDEYRRIPEIVHRTAVEAVLVEKHGLPFLLSGLYKKWNMIWGLATGLCIVAILNCFIWSVEFQDLTNITTEQMERYLLVEGVEFAPEEYGIAFRKGDVKLTNEVQKTLEAMAADGTVAKIAEKWFGSDITVIGK